MFNTVSNTKPHSRNSGISVEKREPSCTVGGSVKSCHGEKYGGSLKN